MGYSYSSKTDKHTVKLDGVDNTSDNLKLKPVADNIWSPKQKMETLIAALNSIRLDSADEVSKVRAQRALTAIGLLVEGDND